jgi:transcriptional regulator with XRE-family HTH domain
MPRLRERETLWEIPPYKESLRHLGRRLLELRKAKGLSVEEVAGQYGGSPHTLHAIESGDARPSRARLRQIAIALGEDPNVLAEDLIRLVRERLGLPSVDAVRQYKKNAEESFENQRSRRTHAKETLEALLHNAPEKVRRAFKRLPLETLEFLVELLKGSRGP